MATKLNNKHLTTIMTKSKSYNSLDVYIALAHISSEVKGKFLIQTYTDNKADLVNLVKKYVKVCYKTIYNNILELIKLGILQYNIDFCAWNLVNMEYMVQNKALKSSTEIDDYLGYVKIRDFFLTSTFQKMKFAEKRCIVYLAQLSDSKSAKSYNEFIMNLSKNQSSWLKILKTKSKYYARNIISRLLKNYKELFTDTSDKLRANDIAPKNITNFKFAFTCNKITKIKNDDYEYDMVKIFNVKEFNLVKSKIKFANITLTKKQIMHIVRAIATIKQWFLKERVVQLIINKYIAIQIHRSRETIKSLPAYLVAIVKAVITEFNELKASLSSKNYEITTYYSNNDITSNSITETLNLL